MKVIIAGSRSIISMGPVADAVSNSDFPITEIVSGGAGGVDTSGELFAKIFKIPVRRFPADWKQHGKSAGPIRNVEMAGYADALIAVWDGKSKGTKHMIDTANKKGLKVYVYEVK